MNIEQLKGSRREKEISEIAIEKCGFYLPNNTRYDYLLNLPQKEELPKKIRETNSYSSDPYKGFGKFDFVMANPPSNVGDE